MTQKRKVSRGFLPALIALTAVASFWISDASQAQGYPTKPVRFIIGQTPGGATDIFGRAIAQGLSEMWGQPTIVENKPGANTIIAAEMVAHAAPDGYTIWVAGDVGLTHNLFMYSKLPYDPRKDFALITRLVKIHQMMIVPTALPANNIAEFVALMKKEGSRYNYASQGIGDPGHINMEWFKTVAGFDMVHIPYKGTPAAMQGLLANEAHVFIGSVLSTEQYIKTGRVKPMVISGKIRSSVYPDVPTLAEAGYPNVVFGIWLALVTAAGTPPDIVKKIADDTRKVMTNPAFRAKFIDPFEFETVNDSPEEFAAFQKADLIEAEKKVKASGAKLD
jgi:tripartite-type tricarboxylate transporter receptor subunit TctC